jgi:hypothetical protein
VSPAPTTTDCFAAVVCSLKSLTIIVASVPSRS